MNFLVRFWDFLLIYVVGIHRLGRLFFLLLDFFEFLVCIKVVPGSVIVLHSIGIAFVFGVSGWLFVIFEVKNLLFLFFLLFQLFLFFMFGHTTSDRHGILLHLFGFLLFVHGFLPRVEILQVILHVIGVIPDIDLRVQRHN